MRSAATISLKYSACVFAHALAVRRNLRYGIQVNHGTDLLLKGLHALSSYDDPEEAVKQLRELLASEGSPPADPSLRAAAAKLGEVLVDLESEPATDDALSAAELEALIDELPCIVYRCSSDLNWTMQYLNRRTRHIIGYEPSALIGNRAQQFGQLIHPDDRGRGAQGRRRRVPRHDLAMRARCLRAGVRDR